jgi:hypothetical protein
MSWSRVAAAARAFNRTTEAGHRLVASIGVLAVVIGAPGCSHVELIHGGFASQPKWLVRRTRY